MQGDGEKWANIVVEKPIGKSPSERLVTVFHDWITMIKRKWQNIIKINAEGIWCGFLVLLILRILGGHRLQYGLRLRSISISVSRTN
jgi:hypothetical protein